MAQDRDNTWFGLGLLFQLGMVVALFLARPVERGIHKGILGALGHPPTQATFLEANWTWFLPGLLATLCFFFAAGSRPKEERQPVTFLAIMSLTALLICAFSLT